MVQLLNQIDVDILHQLEVDVGIFPLEFWENPSGQKGACDRASANAQRLLPLAEQRGKTLFIAAVQPLGFLNVRQKALAQGSGNQTVRLASEQLSAQPLFQPR